MKDSRWQEAVLLGGGGDQPCLDLVHPNGEVSRILDMQTGQSIYAIDRSADHGSLALGTRAGQVLIMPNPWASGELEAQHLIQGAAVLSLCWCGGHHLAVADMVGRVLLWNIHDPVNPQFLDNKGEIICALCVIEDGRIAGLSITGSLYVWHPEESEPVSCFSSTPPPEKFALAKLEYLSRSSEFIHPARHGRLIRMEIDGGDQTSLDAHDTEFYAFQASEESLVTAGLNEQLLKVWRNGEVVQTLELPLRTGLVHLAQFPGHPDLLAAIAEDGTPGIIHLTKGEFIACADQSTGDYRYAVPALTNGQLQRAKTEEAARVAAQLEKALGQENDPTVDGLHQELSRLGFEHVALGMRSAWEMTHGNMLSALEYSARLIELLPIDDPRSFDSLVRHAQLLTRYWQLDSAFGLYSHMQTIDLSFANPLANSYWNSRLKDHRREVIDTAIPLEEIVQANTILQNCFHGTYLLSKQATYRCPPISRSHLEIENEINQAFRSNREDKYIETEVLSVQLLSVQGTKPETIIEIGLATDEHVSVSLGLFINTNISHSDVTPVIMLNWNTQQDYQRNNMEALAFLEQLRNQEVQLDFLDFSYRIAIDAVRRIATEARTQKAAAL